MELRTAGLCASGMPFQGEDISGPDTEGVARALPSATMDQPFGLVRRSFGMTRKLSLRSLAYYRFPALADLGFGERSHAEPQLQAMGGE